MPEFYAMRAYCQVGKDLVFRGSPARCECRDPKQTWSPEAALCVPFNDRYWDKPKVCPADGNPIYPLTGVKRQEESLGISLSHFELGLAFDNRRSLPEANGGQTWLLSAPASFSPLWDSNLHRALYVQGTLATQYSSIAVHRGGGIWETFSTSGGPRYFSTGGQSNELNFLNYVWTLIDRGAKQEEIYDANGTLTAIAFATGGKVSLTYSTASTPAAMAPQAGLLIQATDTFGRTVSFNYEAAPSGTSLPARIRQVTAPDGLAASMAYDTAGNLQSIQWPDGRTRSFLYERVDLPFALTGIADERGQRVSSYGYDAQGRAISTQGGGGANRYNVSYDSPPSWSVTETYDASLRLVWRDHRWQAPINTITTDPLGNSISMAAANIAGMPRLSSQSQPAGSGCAASSSQFAYDERNNVIQRDDFNGTRTCYAYDSSSREAMRVEGLASGASGASCAAMTAAGTALPAGSRKVSTLWHPDWSFTVKQAEPGRITTSVYNGQPDPFAGGSVASCAPAGATLPDGKPIAVLCRQVAQATTDIDGSQGFAASPQAGVAAREQRWTYNQFGQVLTATDALGHTTAYAYYADSAFTGSDPDAVGHTQGDLRQVTNPVGHVTQFTQYNKTGQVLAMIDPNGVVTTNAYDLRRRLVSTSIGGQTSTYDYWPTGLLKKATQPDGSFVSYSYDDAHRLVQVGDNLGNRISYSLDNAGNRTAEIVRDSAGNLRSQMSGVFDALGRMQTLVGRGVAP